MVGISVYHMHHVLLASYSLYVKIKYIYVAIQLSSTSCIRKDDLLDLPSSLPMDQENQQNALHDVPLHGLYIVNS